MKLKVLGPITKSPEGLWRAPIECWEKGVFVNVDLDSTYDPDAPEPTKLFTPLQTRRLGQIWAYRGTGWMMDTWGT